MFTKWLTESLSPKRSKMIVAAALAVSLATASGCSLLPKEQEEEVIDVITPPKLSAKPEHVVKTTTLESKVRGVGRLMATKEEVLYFVPDGKRIKEIYVTAGQQVNAGDPIMDLDVSDLESELRQKRLQQRSEELAMIEKLRKNDGSASAAELEQAKIQFELNREALTKLEESIAKARITAPFSGTVVSIYVKKGDNVKAYDAVAVVADLNELTVIADLSADDLKKVSAGMEAIVDINGVGQKKGKVRSLPNPKQEDPNMPPQRKQESIDNYLVVDLDEFPEGLNRGTPLSVQVITQRKENAIVIPPSALRSYSGRNYVQVVDDKGAKSEVDVEIGQQTSTEVEILKGLTPGQKVVGR